MMNWFDNILCSHDDEYTIIKAIDNKDIHKLKRILTKTPANIHMRLHKWKYTLLHQSVSSSSGDRISIEICKLLIDKGIDIEEKNTSGQTAFLLYAERATGNIINGELEDLFIKSGANIHIIDAASGNGLLHCAYKNDNIDLAIKLLRRGIDYSIKLDYNNTVFMWICCEFYNKCGPDIFNMILETSDINQANDHGDTALMIACDRRDYKCIIKLLDNGADVDLPGYDGNTPLMIAAIYDDRIMIEILIDRGADINIFNINNKDSPLSISCKYNSKNAIDYYLKHGYFDNKTLRHYDIKMMNYITTTFDQYFYIRHIYNEKKEILNEYFSETNLSRIILEYTYYRID